MSQNFTRLMDTSIEAIRENTVSSEYDPAEEKLNVYFQDELIGYVEASLDDERVYIYGIVDGRTIKLDSDRLNPADVQASIEKQDAYAESIAFDVQLTQWITEKSNELSSLQF